MMVACVEALTPLSVLGRKKSLIFPNLLSMFWRFNANLKKLGLCRLHA